MGQQWPMVWQNLCIEFSSLSSDLSLERRFPFHFAAAKVFLNCIFWFFKSENYAFSLRNLVTAQTWLSVCSSWLWTVFKLKAIKMGNDLCPILSSTCQLSSRICLLLVTLQYLSIVVLIFLILSRINGYWIITGSSKSSLGCIKGESPLFLLHLF